MIDLRSDTVTRPTEAMKAAMFKAPIGDDVWGDDPTVNKLEAMAAEMFGMEASLFCASGTMTNQIAIQVHTKPGDEVICHKYAHIYNYEGAGIMANAGCSVKLLGDDRGILEVEEVKGAINGDNVHYARSRLLAVENTSNKGGGTCYDMKHIKNLENVARANNLGFHLDGARLFNALIEKGETPMQYGSTFDSISICLSKGLGCPVGSLLLGSKDFVAEARRVRKRFGGGWRQAGLLAAAGLYAFDNHVERLIEDHDLAKSIANTLAKQIWVNKVIHPETNILIFHVDNGPRVMQAFEDQGILISAMDSHMLRIVTHLDILAADIKKIEKTIENLHI